MKPEDVATGTDRVRTQVDVAMWAAVGLGLAFTAVNVQTFAAAGAPTWSPGWSVAWLLDPMVWILLIAVLRAEQVTARWQVPMGWQVTATKWGAFAATYCMNTWASWRDQLPSGVVLHSVPPLLVLLGAEVAPVLRDRLTEAVHAASHVPGERVASSTLATSEPVLEQAEVPADELMSPPDALEEPESEEGPGDPRVREIAELLNAGCEVTGVQAAAWNEVSERTGRRLLAEARAHLEHNPSTDRPGLHLVELDAAGGTA